MKHTNREIQFGKYESEDTRREIQIKKKKVNRLYESGNSHRKIQIKQMQIGRYDSKNASLKIQSEDINRKHTSRENTSNTYKSKNKKRTTYKSNNIVRTNTNRNLRIGKYDSEIQIGKHNSKNTFRKM